MNNVREHLSKTKRKAEEYKGEQDVLVHKVDVLTAEITNYKKLIEKKDSLIQSFKQNNECENEELKDQLKDLRKQLKAKTSE